MMQQSKRKNHQRNVYLITCIIILSGFLLISFLNIRSFGRIANDDIENITRLVAANIYGEINNNFTTPVAVSNTMANDYFLKEWLAAEKADASDPAHRRRLTQYLEQLKLRYNYDSAFLVSAYSGNYYYAEGLNKTVSKADPHDVWYYNFLAGGQRYDLDVDNDELNNRELTVFINCRMENEQGEVLGVVGVGVKISTLQKMFAHFEQEYGVHAFLTDTNGLVQLDTASERIEVANIFDNPQLASCGPDILKNRTAMNMYWFPDNKLRNCMVTQYVDNLDWYLVIQKDNSAVMHSFQSMLLSDGLILLLILATILLLNMLAIKGNNRKVYADSLTDSLTALPNRKYFDTVLIPNLLQSTRERHLILFDIDGFKKINDAGGHGAGDAILIQVADITQAVFGKEGTVIRWGGDEFIVACKADRGATNDYYARLRKELAAIGVTISVGATRLLPEVTAHALFNQIDRAMYRAKESGRDCCIYFEDL